MDAQIPTATADHVPETSGGSRALRLSIDVMGRTADTVADRGGPVGGSRSATLGRCVCWGSTLLVSLEQSFDTYSIPHYAIVQDSDRVCRLSCSRRR